MHIRVQMFLSEGAEVKIGAPKRGKNEFYFDSKSVVSYCWT